MSLLRINKENSNSQAAHIKIIKTHFSGSDINAQIFAHMEVNVLPTAFAWMVRDGGSGSDENGDLLFEFLRSMPLLCDKNSKSKTRKLAGWISSNDFILHQCGLALNVRCEIVRLIAWVNFCACCAFGNIISYTKSEPMLRQCEGGSCFIFVNAGTRATLFLYVLWLYTFRVNSMQATIVDFDAIVWTTFENTSITLHNKSLLRVLWK